MEIVFEKISPFHSEKLNFNTSLYTKDYKTNEWFKKYE
jgi:hypothetical protein